MTHDPDGGECSRFGVPPRTEAQWLLEAKTTVPLSHAGLVDRPRLYALLDRATRLPVTTVIAPAGSGKTQLLAAWASRCDPPAAWLTLDRADRDPSRLWSAVLAAIRRVVSPQQMSPSSTLSPAPQNDQSADVLAASVVDALTGLRAGLVLVIDDVHVIEGSPGLQGLRLLALHLPVGTRLVMSGTQLPQIPRARLRLEGRLTSITGSDLAFTAGEVHRVLARSGISAPPGYVVDILCKTEGWAAGIRIAAMTYADGPGAHQQWPPRAQVEASDYIEAEVLRGLPDRVRRFLLHTCVCDAICGRLADALTGEQDGAAVLRWLCDHHIFTTRLTGHGEWYRYHGLLADALRGARDTSGLPAEAALCRRAAEWFAAEGHAKAALDCALRSDSWELARDAISRTWFSMYLEGDLHALLAALDRLPAEAFRDHPIARVRDIVSLAFGRRTDAAGLVTPDPSGSLEDLVLAMQAGRLNGDVAIVRSAVAALLEARPAASDEGPVDVRALAFHLLGATEFWAGRSEHAELLLRESLNAARAGGRRYLELGCISLLAGLLAADNRLAAAETLAREGAELSRQRGWEQTAMAAPQWYALGWIKYLRGEADVADAYLDLAEQAAPLNDHAVRATICLTRALVLRQRGDHRRALQRIEAGLQELAGLEARHVLVDYFDAEAARLPLAVGCVDVSRDLLQGAGDPTGPIHLSVARAELLVWEGEPTAAWELMTKAVRDGHGNLDQRTLGHTLLALLEASERGMRSGVDVLAEAVELAAPEHVVAPFVQFGPRIDRLLDRLAQRQSTQREFIAELQRHVASALQHLPPPALRILTAREAEILTHLESRATLPEIATKLFVSPNTVKAHVRSLYRKLDVRSRRQAIDRAEELGLL